MKSALEATKKNATDVVNKIMDKEEKEKSKSKTPKLAQEKKSAKVETKTSISKKEADK